MNNTEYEYVRLGDLEVDDLFSDPVSKKVWRVRSRYIDTFGKVNLIVTASESLTGDPDEVVQVRRVKI